MSSYSSSYGSNGGSYGGGGGYGGASYGDGAPGGMPPYGSAAPSAASTSSMYPSSYGAAATQSPSANSSSTLRRRNANPTDSSFGYGSGMDDSNGKYGKSNRAVVERLDILFPKVDREFTVQTKSGGVMTLAAYGLIAILCLTEILSWRSQNQMELSRTAVDTSLGKRMTVNLNITFPAMACEDLHVDIIDVAGDSQLNIEDTLKKKQLHLNGRAYSQEEIAVETNQHRMQQEEKERILKQGLPENYCGPCYGAQQEEGQCCQTCDELLLAYGKKRWKTDLLRYTSEQCIREGRDKKEPKRIKTGQGCNLSGYMTLNRVSGNFHIAMGEGIERDGRHIHTYLPEDAPLFNASHIIHQLSFGPEDGTEPLNGAIKIVTADTGTTGLFQYFIKVVPTTYIGENILPKMKEGADSLPSLYPEAEEAKTKEMTVETNKYFTTERFMPLMTELLESHHQDRDNPDKAAVHAGHTGGHTNQNHHLKQNAVLPGVFFIYEIYPFAIEIRKNNVPFTHLLIRLMATIGGVMTLLRWLDSCLYERGTKKSGLR